MPAPACTTGKRHQPRQAAIVEWSKACVGADRDDPFVDQAQRFRAISGGARASQPRATSRT
jgi:hypothetical protein